MSAAVDAVGISDQRRLARLPTAERLADGARQRGPTRVASPKEYEAAVHRNGIEIILDSIIAPLPHEATRRAPFALAVACALACHKPPRRASAPHDAGRVQVALAIPASLPPARRSAAWTEALTLRSAVAGFAPRANVLVHAPEGFDPTSPLHIVVLVHGFGHSPYYWLGGGMTDPLTGQRIVGWGGGQRHDLAGTNSLIVAPSCDDRPGRRRLGPIGRAGGLRAFFDELLGEALVHRLGAGRSLRDVASVTFVGSSAGGPSIGALLAQRDLDARVRAIVLFDGLYGDPGVFARWVLGDARRRLVHVFSGAAEAVARTDRLARLLSPRLGGEVRTLSDETMQDAVASHRVVLARVPCEHIGMVGAYLDKVLRGLGLPARADVPNRKTPHDPLPETATALVDGRTEGRLENGDRRMVDGALFDVYDLELAAGEAATIEARGGRVPTFTCATLDAELRVYAGGVVVAANDDARPGRGAAVRLVAGPLTRYRVLVTAHDPWRQEGPYRLTVRREATSR